MSIEVRNFKPPSNSSGVSVNTNISFDLVATDGDQIDINTLQIELMMVSKIDGQIDTLSYSLIQDGYSYGYNYPGQCGDDQDFFNAIDSAISFSGSCIFYQINLSPAQPFDVGQNVTVTVRVADTEGVSMTPFVSEFTTLIQDFISEFSLVFIDLATKIPVYHETLRKTDDLAPQSFTSFCGNWNVKPTPIIRYNEVIIDPEGTSFSPAFSIDYKNGIVNFSEPLDPEDMIDASYQFNYFSDEQILRFFQQATSVYRVNPQFGGPRTIQQADATTRDLIYIGAALFAYQVLLQGLAFQEKRLIFDNHSWEEAWKQVKDIFSSQLEFYDKMWERVLKAKEIRLPNISAVVTPEFTLPGGRARLFRFLFKGGGTS